MNNRTPKPTKYKHYVENYRTVSHSLDVLERLLRKSIATQDRDTNKALLPLYMLTLGACAEARLLKVLMEPNKFSQPEITRVLQSSTHKDRWLTLIKISFLKRVNKPIDDRITESTLLPTDWWMYTILESLIDNELKIIIELRNKLAHGQFENPFVTWEGNYLLSETRVSQAHKKLFANENLLTMKLKRNIITKTLDIVRDLGISTKAFPRDFDGHYRCIKELRQQAKHKNYDKYKNSLINKYSKGLGIKDHRMR